MAPFRRNSYSRDAIPRSLRSLPGSRGDCPIAESTCAPKKVKKEHHAKAKKSCEPQGGLSCGSTSASKKKPKEKEAQGSKSCGGGAKRKRSVSKRSGGSKRHASSKRSCGPSGKGGRSKSRSKGASKRRGGKGGEKGKSGRKENCRPPGTFAYYVVDYWKAKKKADKNYKKTICETVRDAAVCWKKFTPDQKRYYRRKYCSEFARLKRAGKFCAPKRVGGPWGKKGGKGGKGKKC